MGNLIAFQILNTFRSFTNFTENKSRVLAPILLFFIFAALHFYIGTREDTNDFIATGWVIIGIFLLSSLFGLISNRLPSRMEDVQWLYTIPMPFYKIILSHFIAKASLRAFFWIGSAVLADLTMLFIGRTFYNFTVPSIISFLIIMILELSAIATSSMRGQKALVLWTSVLFSIFLLTYSWITYFFIFQGEYLYKVTLTQIGSLLFGELSFIGLFFIVLIFLTSILIIYISSLQMKNKEKLVVEADFWSEFKDFGSLVSSIRGKDEPSWWGGSCLTGIGAFVWFEFLIIRKHAKSMIIQFIVGVILIVVVLNWTPDIFGLIVGLILITTLFGAYFSGVISHAHSGDLFILPGHLFKKIIILEIASIIHPLISMFLLFLVNSLLFNHSYDINMFAVITIFALIVGLRSYTFCQAYLKREDRTILQYYLMLLRNVVIVSLFVLLLIKGLHFVGLLDSYTLPISIVSVSSYLFVRTYNNVQNYKRRFLNVSTGS